MAHLSQGRSTPIFRVGRKQPTRKVIRQQRRIAVFADPLEIGVRGRARPDMFACRRCGTTYSTNMLIGPDADRIAYARDQALRCCDNRCRTCNAPVQRHYSRCDECQDKHRRDERRAWAYRATPVPYDGGWVYSDHVSGYNDGYFDSLDALVEYVADGANEGLMLPAWVHPCREIYPSLDISGAYESMDDDFGVEDISVAERIPDDLSRQMDALVEKINESLKGTIAYHARFSKVIILDAAAFNAEFGNDLNGRPITNWRDREPTVDPILAAKYYRTIAEALSEAMQEREEA